MKAVEDDVAAMPQYLPDALCARVMTRPEDVMILDYEPSGIYCVDHLFALNALPYFDADGHLRNASGAAA